MVILLLVDSGQAFWRGQRSRENPLCLWPGILGAWVPGPLQRGPLEPARLTPAPALGGMC